MRYSLWGDGSRSPGRAATAAGLLWVYSGVPWLLGMSGALNQGWILGGAACGVCLAGSLAVGVGLCACERWAWAAGTCLAILYTASSAGLAGRTGAGSGIGPVVQMGGAPTRLLAGQEAEFW